MATECSKIYVNDFGNTFLIDCGIELDGYDTFSILVKKPYQITCPRGRVVDEHRPDVHRGVVHLAVEEHRVLSAELLHPGLRPGRCRGLL